ncbi:hypothetical protein ACX27_24515 [Nostoc piscinale CENA21]|uniref:Uncharacterized protein n=1 Tax=Nostoc piscinale CENA21 TaxID=224013 RepID=A0A0M4T041_9NOSO|nr:hypothetical protein ACX27_24515 [Nostoc piscinale CENA21]
MLEDIALTGAFFAPAKYARNTFQFKTKLLTSNSALSTQYCLLFSHPLIPIHENLDTDVSPESFAASKFFNCVAQRKACGIASLRDATRTLRASLRASLRIVNWYQAFVQFF